MDHNRSRRSLLGQSGPLQSDRPLYLQRDRAGNVSRTVQNPRKLRRYRFFTGTGDPHYLFPADFCCEQFSQIFSITAVISS